MKILLTGAHFTPALAVIEEFKKNKDIEIVYVGRKTTQEGDSTKSQESKILTSLGVKFIPIITGRLQRVFTIYTIPSLLKIPIGFLQALYIILLFRPDVILSFGGYVAVPLVFVGWLFSIPIMLHEQTLVSGLANKISSLFANKIAFSFEQGQKFAGKQTMLTGNPLREEIVNYSKKILPKEYEEIFKTSKIEKLPLILITCGNQGSHIINRTVEKCLDELTKITCIIHASGDNKYSDFENLKKLQNKHYLVKKWIAEEYGIILSKVDMVISRAGINTLTELSYICKPALVIPLVQLYQNEQNKNAKFFENIGLVKILPQSKLSPLELLNHVKEVLNNLDQFKKSAKIARKVVILDAAKRLVLETIILAKKS